MTDTEKILLIDHIIADAFEYSISEKDPFYQGIVSAIASIVNFEEDAAE